MTHTPNPDDRSWSGLPSHRRWLLAEVDRLLGFAEGARHPDGGFAWLDGDGRARLAEPVATWITGRMTHVFALAHLLGRPGAGRLVDHGVEALHGRLHDHEHGGWYAGTGPDQSDKSAYEHAFVVLAASSATAADRPGARSLLEDALAVVENRFWDPDAGMVVDACSRDWRRVDEYRGVNANMHTVEAFLAAADVTGDARWRERALSILTRVVHGFARENHWRLPEHFDPQWRPLLDYNREQPEDQFRPYGMTPGHLLEWSRLALHARASLGDDAPDWLLEDAAALFERAVQDGWSVDGREGFVYTTDWDGTPIVRDRLHWVVAEAVAAAAALRAATGDAAYEEWYRTWWDHAAALFVDRARGSWHHQLDAGNQPSETVWSGKPDAYHAVQACLLPMLPLDPSLATALRTGRADPTT